MSNYSVDALGRGHIAPYGDAVREVAFELWWMECNRDAVKVAELLATDPYWRDLAQLGPDDRAPDVDTIRRWAHGNYRAGKPSWEDESHKRMRELAPYMLEHGAVRLVYSYRDAVETMVRVANGKGSGKDGQVSSGDRIAADNAYRIVQLISGDQIAALAKPKIDDAVDFDKLDSIEAVMEAERSLGS